MNTLHTLAAPMSADFNPLNAQHWLELFGPAALIGVWLILFAETGLMAGFFLPGDSLLFIAGLFASDASKQAGIELPIWGLLIGGPIFAITGAQVGHWFGAKYGPKLFDRPDSRFFKREYVDKAQFYFNKFGPRRAIVLARFMPFVRTFMNPVAGALGMPKRQFLIWNIVGGILWVDGIVLLGYLLAKKITDAIGGPDKIDRYIIPFVLIIVFISLIPIIIEMIKGRRQAKAAKRESGQSVGSHRRQ